MNRFGGLGGIEEAIESDNSVPVGPEDAHTLFDAYLNVCPQQGSRTIRTEVSQLSDSGIVEGVCTGSGARGYVLSTIPSAMCTGRYWY